MERAGWTGGSGRRTVHEPDKVLACGPVRPFRTDAHPPHQVGGSLFVWIVVAIIPVNRARDDWNAQQAAEVDGAWSKQNNRQ